MNKRITKELIEKYKENTCTEKEKAQIESWYLKHLEESHSSPSQERINSVNLRMKKAIFDRIQPEKHTYSLFSRIGIAASFLLFLSVGGYFLLIKHPTTPAIAKNEIHDAIPGSNKAILTLSNGHKIILNNVVKGLLTREGNTRINKTDDGEIVYQKENTAYGQRNLSYNTISTPRGGQWKLTLADGSRVWLNANSTIRYPITFPANEREIEITGEAYLEVAKDQHKPFRVHSNGQTVEVLGTHFNINAYADEEETKTTLLEGSVKIIKGQSMQLIKPGQQARTRVDKNGITVYHDVDMAAEVSWKDGYFRFNNADLPSVMRQFARWYDVEVIDKSKPGVHEFNGKISRQANLSRVLKILSLGGLHFKIEGKQLIVLP
jgi:transmembrane sensor